MSVSALVNLLDGLSLTDPKAQIKLSYNQEQLIIEEIKHSIFKMTAVNTFRIPLCNLLDTIFTTEKEMIETSKSVIGRGVVGGLIFGPAGLILGGLSGIGNKKSTQTRQVYIVSYVSTEGEVKNITFSLSFLTTDVTRKFDKNLRKQLANVPKSSAAIQILGDSGVADTPKDVIL